MGEMRLNCSNCDCCYSNETMRGTYICVNGKSEHLGEFVDGLGLAEDDMDCVIVDGKDRSELRDESGQECGEAEALAERLWKLYRKEAKEWE